MIIFVPFSRLYLGVHFIGDILGNVSVQNRIFGTAATVSMCVRNGANIVRVHDVYQMKQVVTVTEKILN